MNEENKTKLSEFEALELTLSFADELGSPGSPGNIVLLLSAGAMSVAGDAVMARLGGIPDFMPLGEYQLLRPAETSRGLVPVYFMPGILMHSLDKPQDTVYTEKQALESVAQQAQKLMAADGLAVGAPPHVEWKDSFLSHLGKFLIERVQAQVMAQERNQLLDETKGHGLNGARGASKTAPRI